MKSIVSALIGAAVLLAAPAAHPLPRTVALVGYGLVFGLNGTGDTVQKIPMTQQVLKALLTRLGFGQVDPSTFQGKVAAVMVTAEVEPSASGAPKVVDVVLGAMGDATSLEGGTLAMTPLMGRDGRIYVLAQGALTACHDPRNPNASCIPGGGVVLPEPVKQVRLSPPAQ